MANLKSSKKDIENSKRNRLQNLLLKTKMKTNIKKAIKAIEEKADNALELVKEALKTLDKNAGQGIIKKNSAARKKSRLMLFYNKSQVQEKAKPKAKSKTVSKAKPTAKVLESSSVSTDSEETAK